MNEVDPVVPFFKKKAKGRPTNNRKRSASPQHTNAVASSSAAEPSTSTQQSSVVLPSKRQGGGLLSAGTKRTSSQRDNAGLDPGDEDPPREGPSVNWTAAGSHQQAAQDILAGDELDALEAKRMKIKDTAGSDEEGPDDGLYHGAAGYKSHIKKNKEVPKAMRVGPQRSSGSTIRTVTITDYQPDVCKDYKETGYCGFGDTCKFLHDRGTYLAGWQLDKLAAQPKKQVGDAASSDDDSDDEDVPFACLICRKPYTDPVVTRCGHYFCATCAIKRYAKTPKCLACGAATGGIFNRADKILERIKKRKAEDDVNEDDDGIKEQVELEGIEEAD